MTGPSAASPAAGPAPAGPASAEPSLARDLISLTKPRIISLLLVTTLAPMFVAGSPSWATILWTGIGGYLMAGGANAVNMYIDRDIDDLMARTKLRPIPSGRMAPRAVLAFGVAIATAATWLLSHYVNVLTAALALAGFYFYVFVYTRW
ncbi:MAG: UbiA family prenyltransferase, partial [Gemmatimonadaceae bacterium]